MARFLKYDSIRSNDFMMKDLENWTELGINL